MQKLHLHSLILKQCYQLYIQEKNLYDYNKSYSRELDVNKFLAEEDLNTETTFDCRVYGSNIKINGELSDNWLKFKVDNYIEIEHDSSEEIEIRAATVWAVGIRPSPLAKPDHARLGHLRLRPHTWR